MYKKMYKKTPLLFSLFMIFSLFSVKPLAANMGTFVYTNAPLYRQYNNYSCGPCSGLQAINGMSLAHRNKVAPGAAGSQVDQQKTLASDMGTTSSGGTYVYRVVNGINKYQPIKTYKYTLGKNVSTSKFYSDVYNSLLNDCTAILHARTRHLSYYNGREMYHYICITQLHQTFSSMKLKDCNYNDPYYGEFTISPLEAYRSINTDNDRYYIHA